MKKRYICPICGHPYLEEGPLQFIENGKEIVSYSKGAPTFEICPCCGVEFGYDDNEFSWEDLRKKWIEHGAIWSRKIEKPKNWNLNKQLLNLKKIKISN